MKKIKLLILILLVLIPSLTFAKEEKNVYLFRGEGCPHCEAELEFLNSIKEEYDINIIEYEVWNNSENYEFYNEVAEKLGVSSTSVPFTIIGDHYFSGYKESYNSLIKSSIESLDENNIDVIQYIKDGKDISGIEFNKTKTTSGKNVYLFRGEGCPHCEAELEFLNSIKEEYDINIIEYEVWNNSENHEFYNEVAEKLGVSSTSVPFTIIGNHYFSGYSIEYNETIESNIKDLDENNIDVIQYIKDGKDISNIEFNKDSSIKTINVFGHAISFDAKEVSLPIISMVIGFVDGFNPCSMWVLLFLIGMLINMKDRKKMFILGFTFLISSAVTYLLIMGAWLKVSIDLSTISWIKYIIASVALIAGTINIINFIKELRTPNGCTVVNEKKRTKTFGRIRKILSEKKFYLAILGIIALAVSVNIIELACSLGLPLIFTQILSYNDLTVFQYIIYMMIYVFFYLIDDIVIFSIAAFTLNIKGISGKYTKYSHLVGGIIMLIIGLLMIIKPELLMFNF